MRTKIHKMGNSLGVHIPKEIAERAHLVKGKPVSVEFEKGNIVIKPSKEETLEDLVKLITPENNQPLIDFGPDVGREIVEYE